MSLVTDWQESQRRVRELEAENRRLKEWLREIKLLTGEDECGWLVAKAVDEALAGESGTSIDLEEEVTRLRGERDSFENEWKAEQELRIAAEDEVARLWAWLEWFIHDEWCWNIERGQKALVGEEPPEVADE